MPTDPADEPRRDAFDSQATTKLLDQVHRATRARMRVYAGSGKVNDGDVDDMVMNAITDTLDGTLGWHHETKPLLQHLLDTVRFRVRDEARKGWRNNARSKRTGEATDTLLTESWLAGSSSDSPDEALHVRQTADGVVAELRGRIGDDREVSTLFDAMVERGLLERTDIMKETGMTAAAYRNARRRLDRTLLELPAETRNAVVAALQN